LDEKLLNQAKWFNIKREILPYMQSAIKEGAVNIYMPTLNMHIDMNAGGEKLLVIEKKEADEEDNIKAIHEKFLYQEAWYHQTGEALPTLHPNIVTTDYSFIIRLALCLLGSYGGSYDTKSKDLNIVPTVFCATTFSLSGDIFQQYTFEADLANDWL
jgi:hypothetical protein